MDRMPVPVHHTVCAVCQMTVCLKSELSLIRSPSRISLCFCFQNKVVISLQRTCHITAKCDLCPCQIILCWMINICACNRQCLRCMIMVYIRLYSIGISPPFKVKIMSDKLILNGLELKQLQQEIMVLDIMMLSVGFMTHCLR